MLRLDVHKDGAKRWTATCRRFGGDLEGAADESDAARVEVAEPPSSETTIPARVALAASQIAASPPWGASHVLDGAALAARVAYYPPERRSCPLVLALP